MIYMVFVSKGEVLEHCPMLLASSYLVPEIHGENPFEDDEEGNTERKQRRDNLWHPKNAVSLGGVEPPIKGGYDMKTAACAESSLTAIRGGKRKPVSSVSITKAQ
ncbi:hypothetical protein TWF217_001083 [Orbilia oligospora]|nr:hypothetical protein TWF217_001083 [Orbilia oligospora]